MTKTSAFLSGVLLLTLSTVQVNWSQESPPRQEKAKVETKKIPVELIYSTSRQKGLKLLDQGQSDEGFEFQMRELQQHAIKTGASNIFLVRGDDIRAGVRATWAVFCAAHSVDYAVNADPESKSQKYWLAAYLGVAGSSPPAWLVDSVQIKGNQVVVRYKAAANEIQSDDEHPYFVWVPLGGLMAGTYSLELFEQTKGQTVLQRRVTVKQQ